MKRCLLFTSTLLLAATSSAFAQDPVKVSPGSYKVLLENDHVRVLEFRSRPGDKEPVHSHPEAVVYILAGGKGRFTTNGKAEELDAKPGTVMWTDATTHAYEHFGPGDARALMIEMKTQQKSSQGTASTTESAVRTELAQLTERFINAMKAGDVETPVSLWTEDGWAAEPGRAQPIMGRAGMRQWFTEMYGTGRITNLAFHPSDLKVHGDYAYETGHFVFTLQPAGGAAMNDQGHYFIEWQRGADGQWRARREVWNSATPAAAR